MTKNQLVKILAERIGEDELSKSKVMRVVDGLIETVIDLLVKQGEKVNLPGLGILAVKKRAPRTARNPRTGEAVQVPAKTVVKFRVAKSLKEAVK